MEPIVEVTERDIDRASRWFEQWQGCAGERDALAYWFAVHRSTPSPDLKAENAALVEKVARAIERQFNSDEDGKMAHPDDWPTWIPEAKAAIAALQATEPRP